jgi:hypothetical protein
MEGALWVLGVTAAVAAVAVVCRWLGFSARRTVLCAGIALAGLALTAVFECLGENRYPPPPSHWPWSPRREFCSDEGSWAARGALPLLAVPFVLTLFGALLWSRKRGGLASVAFGLVAATPLLMPAYVSALPYYRTDEYPILHDPYVRPATEEQPARACFAYGIVRGPQATRITDESERICADLRRTGDSEELVPGYETLPGYAYASVPYNLEWLGKRLTEENMSAGTSYRGLVAERVYTLPGAEARAGAFFVRTCITCPQP